MKFCFFGNISGALRGKTVGGAELQISLLAKALALKGHEVVIVDPAATESFVNSDGIKLINVPNWNKGIKGIRLFQYRVPALKEIFANQNADYYYVRMRTYFHLLPYLVSKKMKSKFILSIACDLDVASLWKKFKYEYRTNFNLFRFLTLSLPSDLVFNYLLKRSDYVILQHSGQVLNRSSTKGKIVIFSNIFDFEIVKEIKGTSKGYFVHPGALNILKGSHNLNQLINILDKKDSIVIIGQPTDKKSKKIYQFLKKKENVVLKGRLSHKETIQSIANAKALINTSNFEGFPNIFLEAWAIGVPVISLNVNPGNVLIKYNLGIYCNGDLNKMKKSIESDTMSNFNREKLISYVHEFHNFSTSADRFLNLVSNS